MGIEGRFQGVIVRPRPGEPDDRLIKRFMKKTRNDGIINEVRLRQGYEKPSVKRRRKIARSRFQRTDGER